MTNVTAVCVQVPQLAFTEEERSRTAVLTVPKMRKAKRRKAGRAAGIAP